MVAMMDFMVEVKRCGGVRYSVMFTGRIRFTLFRYCWFPFYSIGLV